MVLSCIGFDREKNQMKKGKRKVTNKQADGQIDRKTDMDCLIITRTDI